MTGPQAELALRGFRADVLFLGVDSLGVEVGLMTPHALQAQLNAQTIRCARRVIGVADPSKLLRRDLSVIAQMEALHTRVTDDGARPEVVDALRAQGVEVIVVPGDEAREPELDPAQVAAPCAALTGRSAFDFDYNQTKSKLRLFRSPRNEEVFCSRRAGH